MVARCANGVAKKTIRPRKKAVMPPSTAIA
jgi:hypothetical protein